MVVQHNITSMNANRQLGIVSGNVGKATEKLASGYRVNKAADDAREAAQEMAEQAAEQAQEAQEKLFEAKKLFVQ